MLRTWTFAIVGMVIACGLVVAPASAVDKGHSHAGHDHGKSKGAHAGHNHDEHHLCEADIVMPKDFPSAVTRIKACRNTIAEEIAEGHLEEVHAPLDEATIILGRLMPIARDSGVPKARWHEINTAAKDLRKRLGDLHAAIDKQAQVDFKSVSVPIDRAIKSLETVARASSSTASR